MRFEPNVEAPGSFDRYLDELHGQAPFGERERKTHALYYGLDGHGGISLGEIGSLPGITPGRIPQIRNRAPRELRRSKHGQAFDRLRCGRTTGRSGADVDLAGHPSRETREHV